MSKEFVIQPNCSLSTHSSSSFLWVFGLVMAGITLVLSLQGLWLVAPFMGADLLLLVYAFRVVGQQCRILERVVIEADQLTIYHEEKRRPDSWSFPLHWVNVDLRKDSVYHDRTHLLIGSHGKWVELATFLNEEERISLASAIKSAIISARQPQWAQS